MLYRPIVSSYDVFNELLIVQCIVVVLPSWLCTKPCDSADKNLE